ncbi:MAG: GAF domain-containing protein [Spirochaetaceae bacterium]
MNKIDFKIYVEHGIEKRITSINDYDYTEFCVDEFEDKIQNHLASKISQSFIFFLTPTALSPMHDFMVKHGKSKFQFVIIGGKFHDDGEIPLNSVLSIHKRSITKNNFKWLLAKFRDYISVEKSHVSYNSLEADDIAQDQKELIAIGRLLAEERNRDKLIQKILETSIKITGADAGSIFLVVANDDGTKGLLFKNSFTFSRKIDFHEFVMPLNEESIAGFCACNDEVVNIPDVYQIPESAPFSFHRAIDEKYDYVSKSMLVFPMKNHLGEMQGVIQLINSKEHFDITDDYDETESHKIYLDSKEDFYNKVYPFAERYEDLMLAVAGQATVALDNIKMIKQLEGQFDGMVRASVDAIDSKDPATKGHSARVAEMGIRMLKCINNLECDRYKDLYFTPKDLKQMEYAAILHDYGKVYIDNEIFLKAKKLFPKDFSILMLRLDLIIHSLRNCKDDESLRKAEEVVKIRDNVIKLNEPRIFNENPSKIIDELLIHKDELIAYDSDNNKLILLTDEEIVNLQISRGTLNQKERKVIESHVTYTQHFLESIPWPKYLERIPEIAGGHHELLDGSGYPLGLSGDQLCLESRVLAILDIFDALSASDRPYKDAVPFERVKSILIEEVGRGKLDKELLDLFLEHEIYEGLY